MNSLRIFCVEDDMLLGEVLARLFRSRGHHVEHATHGAEAWGRLAVVCHNFDVIVSDHQLPGMNGTSLVERLRATGYRGRIVIYSSSLSTETADRYRTLGVNGLVAKSSRPDALVALVERT